jgi:hypothetical protein
MNSKKILMMAVAGLLATMTVKAQVAQINASGSYLKGVEDNKSSLWGGGVGAKGFIGDHFALGASLHAYPKKTASGTINGYNYTKSDNLSNLAGTIDFLIGDRTSTVQPYIGVDAGASFNNHTVTYTNSTNQYIENQNKKTYFLLAPKAGLNFGLGQAFGLFAQAQYNVTFGDGHAVAIDDVPNPFTTNAVSKFFTIDAGLYFRIMPATK